MPANKGKPSSVQLDLPDLWISATHRTLDQSDEVNEGSAMMSHCSHDSLDHHKPGLCSCVLRTNSGAVDIIRTAYYIRGPELMKIIFAILYVSRTMGLACCYKTFVFGMDGYPIQYQDPAGFPVSSIGR